MDEKNYDPPTDPKQLELWEAARAQLKRQHHCQCFKCTWIRWKRLERNREKKE